MKVLVHLQKPYPNQLIEVIMERFKKNAGRLAFWNLMAPYGYIVIGMLLLFIFRNLRFDNAPKVFSLTCALVEIPLFTFVYLYWFRFLIGINKYYPGNTKLLLADVMGWISVSMRILTTITGLVMLICPVFLYDTLNVHVRFTPDGALPISMYGGSFTYYGAVQYIITALMFLFFMLASEPKSKARIYAMIIFIMYSLGTVLSTFVPANIMLYYQFISDFVILLFMWNIRNGYEFPHGKTVESLE